MVCFQSNLIYRFKIISIRIGNFEELCSDWSWVNTSNMDTTVS
ncbi:short chain dehydrogenase [Streptococcus parauberis KRS-02109]|nr:short chain dehydrogenase [Streptococcus parauberis KRS-02109]